MFRFKYKIIIGIFFIFPQISYAAFPGNFADAQAYNISVTKVELCRSSSCSNPFILGSGSKTFDISSSTAGSDVGSYVSIQGIPLHQTWSHVRVTLSTTMTIAGSGTDQNGNSCKTDSTNGASGHAALGVAINAAGSGTTQTLVVPNVNAFGAGVPSAGDYSGYSLSKSDNANSMTVTYALSRPYTCKGKMPRIAVQFDTKNTLKFYDAGGGGVCRVYPMPPTVTITASD
jgi:hypothetical protein